MSQAYRDDLVASTSELFRTGDFSDLLIKSHGREFRVHRAIICPRSKFFASACTGGFNEATSGVINLDGDDPDTVARMLSYLYTTDYDDGLHNKSNDSDILMEAETQNEVEGGTGADVEAEADAHPDPAPADDDDTDGDPGEAAAEEAPPVPAESENAPTEGSATDEDSEFENKASSALHNNVLVYGIAEKYEIPGLQMLAKEYFSACAALCWPPDNIEEIIRLVYETTPDKDRGLRNIVTNLCVPHLDTLIQSESFRNTTIELSAFCYDLLRESSASLDRANVDLSIQLSDLQTEKQDILVLLSDANATMSKLKDKIEQADANVNIIDDITARYPNCRHCQKPLRWFINAGIISGPGPLVLRCRSCHTGHQL